MLFRHTKLENHYFRGQFLCKSRGKNQFAVDGVNKNANVNQKKVKSYMEKCKRKEERDRQ